jgi:hypothetical protein
MINIAEEWQDCRIAELQKGRKRKGERKKGRKEER